MFYTVHDREEREEADEVLDHGVVLQRKRSFLTMVS